MSSLARDNEQHSTERSPDGVWASGYYIDYDNTAYLDPVFSIGEPSPRDGNDVLRAWDPGRDHVVGRAEEKAEAEIAAGDRWVGLLEDSRSPLDPSQVSVGTGDRRINLADYDIDGSLMADRLYRAERIETDLLDIGETFQSTTSGVSDFSRIDLAAFSGELRLEQHQGQQFIVGEDTSDVIPDCMIRLDSPADLGSSEVML